MAQNKKNRKSLWLLLIAIIVLGGLAFAKSQGHFEEDDSIEVETELAGLQSITEVVSASGKIFPEKEVKISSDVSGEVVELHVEEGDSVKAGQLLAKVDPDIYLTNVERAEASVKSAKAQEANAKAQIEQLKAQRIQLKVQLDNTERILNRNKGLHKNEVLSDAELEASETAFLTAKANYESAAANIESAEQSALAAKYTVESTAATVKESRKNLSKTSIYAPVSGIVSKLNIEQGERVVGTLQMAGTEIMRIANLDVMEVQVDVSESDVLRVKLKDKVNIEVDAYMDRIFEGFVTEIANSSNDAGMASLTSDQVTNFTVKIRIDPNSYRDLLKNKKSYAFRPGMSAAVDINTHTEKDALSIPIQSVTTREDEDKMDKDGDPLINEVVFVCSGNTVEERIVETGIQDDKYIHITKGLKKGEELVKGPYSAVSRDLAAGDIIRRKEKKEDAEAIKKWKKKKRKKDRKK